VLLQAEAENFFQMLAFRLHLIGQLFENINRQLHSMHATVATLGRQMGFAGTPMATLRIKFAIIWLSVFSRTLPTAGLVGMPGPLYQHHLSPTLSPIQCNGGEGAMAFSSCSGRKSVNSNRHRHGDGTFRTTTNQVLMSQDGGKAGSTLPLCPRTPWNWP